MVVNICGKLLQVYGTVCPSHSGARRRGHDLKTCAELTSRISAVSPAGRDKARAGGRVLGCAPGLAGTESGEAARGAVQLSARCDGPLCCSAAAGGVSARTGGAARWLAPENPRATSTCATSSLLLSGASR